MNYNKIFTETFNSLTPITNNEEICSNVMERARKMNEKKKTTLKRPLAVVVAAAATIAAATVSVGAATGWDYLGVFGQIFGTKSENIKDNIVPEATVLCDTIDTMNFEIVAVAADKHSVLTILDVYSENGFKLIEKTEQGTMVYPIQDLFIYLDSNSIGGSGTGISPLEISEEKVRLSIRMGTENMIKDKKITINAVKENKREENGEYIIESDNYQMWSAEFMVSYSGEETRYEKEINLSPAKVTSAEISSISACIKGENLDKLFEEYHDYDDNYLILDNGEKVMISDTMSSGYIIDDPRGSTILSLGFAEPVNPEDVKIIIIGDNEIKLK